MVSGFLKKRYGIRRVMECCISFCMGGERHQARGVSILGAVMMRPREASVAGREYFAGGDDEARGGIRRGSVNVLRQW